jgi:hypothetical protein
MFYFKLFLSFVILPIFTLQAPTVRADDLLGPRFNLSDRPILFAQNLQTVQQTESGLENYLAQASKAPEKRVGISIKNIQLGMNEYNFLTEVSKIYPFMIKNQSQLMEMFQINIDDLNSMNYNFYLLFHKEQEEDYQAISKGTSLVLMVGLAESFFGLAVFKDGILNEMIFPGVTFEKIFNVSNSPAKVFFQAFLNNYPELDLSVEKSTKEEVDYSYYSDDLTWSFSATVKKADNSVTDITLSSEIDEEPSFD